MHNIRKLPTFVFYKNGQQQKHLEFSGANIPKLEEIIQQHGTPASFSGQGNRLGGGGTSIQSQGNCC